MTLTDPERNLIQRLGVFLGGFDLEAAQAVGVDTVEHYQVVDLLTLLIDKSLVVADDVSGTMRYRLLETVRQYALEKLGESGDVDALADLYRRYYTDNCRYSTPRCQTRPVQMWRPQCGSAR